jgi:hypothetical protein
MIRLFFACLLLASTLHASADDLDFGEPGYIPGGGTLVDPGDGECGTLVFNA